MTAGSGDAALLSVLQREKEGRSATGESSVKPEHSIGPFRVRWLDTAFAIPGAALLRLISWVRLHSINCGVHGVLSGVKVPIDC